MPILPSSLTSGGRWQCNYCKVTHLQRFCSPGTDRILAWGLQGTVPASREIRFFCWLFSKFENRSAGPDRGKYKKEWSWWTCMSLREIRREHSLIVRTLR